MVKVGVLYLVAQGTVQKLRQKECHGLFDGVVGQRRVAVADVQLLYALQRKRRTVVEHQFHDVERPQQRGTQAASTLLPAVANQKRYAAARERKDVHNRTVVVVAIVAEHDALCRFKHVVKLRKIRHFSGTNEEKCNKSNIFPRNYFASQRKCRTFAPAIEPPDSKALVKVRLFLQPAGADARFLVSSGGKRKERPGRR